MATQKMFDAATGSSTVNVLGGVRSRLPVGAADRVLVVSLMKSGTHLIQELMVALGYGMYGQSRITPDIGPVLDEETRERIGRMVFDEPVLEKIERTRKERFARETDKGWEALGWAWQIRLGMPLASRYGVELIETELVQRALHRTRSCSFSETPAGVCWILTELDIKKVDGRFLQEWAETREPRLIFLYRDPRDVVLSMVNFLSGKTAQGYGNFSDFHVFSRILESMKSFEDRLTYALTDPSFPGSGDHERMLWLLEHPDVCKVSFEELVGSDGGGSADAQQAAVARICSFVGCDPSRAEVLAEGLFRRDAFSFYKGQIGAWREAFTPALEELVEQKLGRVVELYGYA